GTPPEDTRRSCSPSPLRSYGIGHPHNPTPRSVTAPGLLWVMRLRFAAAVCALAVSVMATEAPSNQEENCRVFFIREGVVRGLSSGLEASAHPKGDRSAVDEGTSHLAAVETIEDRRLVR